VLCAQVPFSRDTPALCRNASARKKAVPGKGKYQHWRLGNHNTLSKTESLPELT
jgi:hypothetical protein